MIAWDKVTQPKNKGGLGVINLILQNDALFMKHLHKFYSKHDLPWVKLIWSTYYRNKVPHGSKEVGSFWWKDVLRLNVIFKGVAKCTIGKGDTILFWDDLWSDSVLCKIPSTSCTCQKQKNISTSSDYRSKPPIFIQHAFISTSLSRIFSLTNRTGTNTILSP
uniref:Reverse transcriptase zinc-binding domain-containing protein n=1 Tax=Arundo donax TaxID=35708 RepID=A0A0A9B1V0_ARUDO